MMIPKTADGRVLFAVPWNGVMVLGTTDTPINEIREEPLALESEIEFVIDHFNHYSSSRIERKDIQSVFVGLRPLVKAGGGKSTSLLSRDHTILVSAGGLVTITGGKWTTYRKMAEDAVNNAVFISKQDTGDCRTTTLAIGTPEKRADMIKEWEQADPVLSAKLHEAFHYTYADLLYAIRFELAETLEDLLARRTRLLFMDARAALALAPQVLAFLAKEKGLNEAQVAVQQEAFKSLASGYILS